MIQFQKNAWTEGLTEGETQGQKDGQIFFFIEPFRLPLAIQNIVYKYLFFACIWSAQQQLSFG